MLYNHCSSNSQKHAVRQIDDFISRSPSYFFSSLYPANPPSQSGGHFQLESFSHSGLLPSIQQCLRRVREEKLGRKDWEKTQKGERRRALMMDINRRSSVGTLQQFLKQFQIQMSFYYLINGGFNSLTTIEQLHSFYSNLGSYYHSTEDIFAPAPTLYKCEQLTQCDPSPQPTIHEPTIVKPPPTTAKPKRRVEKTVEKEILSAKKNSESNIINQFYSFFSSREKSQHVVERISVLMGKSTAQIEKILPFFYSAIRFINAKRGRKYVNVASFLKFFTAEEFGEYLGDMREKIDQLEFLSVEELCEIFRRCAKYFLKEVSIHAILTSKRISIVSKQEHLKKRRKILRTILGY